MSFSAGSCRHTALLLPVFFIFVSLGAGVGIAPSTTHAVAATATATATAAGMRKYFGCAIVLDI